MTRFTTSDGVGIAYGDSDPIDGTPVVLCHGLAASGLQFAADAEYFAARGYRVLVPELRGHGQSGKGADYSLKRMALDLSEMLAHARVGPVHWVGNSLGGILALEMLGRTPEVFRTLATFGTSYALNLPAWPARLGPLAYKVLGRAFVARFMSRATTRDPAARELIASVLRTSDPQVFGLTSASCARYDFIAIGAAVQVPILMLRGGRDGAVNGALKATLAAMRGLPNFTLVELPEGGHCANLDSTNQWRKELLKFWDRK